MIKRLINKILKSINNLPAQYKVALARILTGIMESIMALEENKVDKEEGKELSSNDFTDELKDKLENLPEEFIQENADWESESGVTKILNKPDLTVYPDSAEWDKTTKKIYFKHQNTILNPFTIDGTDFIKDGMVDEVKIENNNLVIVFNTDSGKETIEIPLSEIFNPDNYYTKAKTDELFVKKVNGKDLSSNDFTDELKEKLESLGYSIVFLNIPDPTNIDKTDSAAKAFVEEINSIEDKNKIIVIINGLRYISPYNNRGIAIYPTNNQFFGYNFDMISFGDILHNVTGYNATKRTYTYKDIRPGAYVTPFIVKFGGQPSKGYFTTGLSISEFKAHELISLKTLNEFLGNITSYTNEEIEQLIAQGYDVKVFKLDITEDKTLLQQILVDNPEDGSIDITQALYFVYDSIKDKYYDVNSLIIDTVENDRQINIVGGLGRLDYTAIKINADDAEYIVNPSHVEGGNADWQENDEDKASYVKNRTHYGEKNPRYNTMSDGMIDNDIDVSDLDINDVINFIKQHPNSTFMLRPPFDTDYYGNDTKFEIWKWEPDGKIHIGNTDSSIVADVDSIEEAFALFTTIVDNKYYYYKDARIVVVSYDRPGEFVFYNRFNWTELYEYINIKKLDSAYLEDLTDEEINQILE